MAVSASAVEESTFIWNPNLIALSSSIALAAAWRAWRSAAGTAGGSSPAPARSSRCTATSSASILTPVIAALLVADLRRRRRAIDGSDVVAGAALGWIVLALLSYVPLVIHELGERRLRAPRGARVPRRRRWPGRVAFRPAPDRRPARPRLAARRLLTDGPARDAPGRRGSSRPRDLARLGRGPWDSASVGRQRAGGSPHLTTSARRFAGWRSAWLWTIVALAVGASSLATVVPDCRTTTTTRSPTRSSSCSSASGSARCPAAFRARACRPTPGSAARGRPSRSLAAAILVGLVGWNFVQQPPAVARWRLARRGGSGRAGAVARGGGPLVLSSLPTFKSDEAVRMPLEASAGVDVSAPPGGPGSLDSRRA